MPIVTIQVTREGTAPGASSTTPEQKDLARERPQVLDRMKEEWRKVGVRTAA